MTQTTTLEEKVKTLMIDWGIDHIGDLFITDIEKLFQETIEQAMPEKWKNVMGIGYRLGYNAALEEYRENLLKAIGKAGE